MYHLPIAQHQPCKQQDQQQQSPKTQQPFSYRDAPESSEGQHRQQASRRRSSQHGGRHSHKHSSSSSKQHQHHQHSSNHSNRDVTAEDAATGRSSRRSKRRTQQPGASILRHNSDASGDSGRATTVALAPPPGSTATSFFGIDGDAATASRPSRSQLTDTACGGATSTLIDQLLAGSVMSHQPKQRQQHRRASPPTDHRHHRTRPLSVSSKNPDHGRSRPPRPRSSNNGPSRQLDSDDDNYCEDELGKASFKESSGGHRKRPNEEDRKTEAAAGKALARQWQISREFVLNSLMTGLVQRMRDLDQRASDPSGLLPDPLVADQKLAELNRLRQLTRAVSQLDVAKRVYSSRRSGMMNSSKRAAGGRRKIAQSLGLNGQLLPRDLLSRWSSRENEYQVHWMALLERTAAGLADQGHGGGGGDEGRYSDNWRSETARQLEFAERLVELHGFVG